MIQWACQIKGRLLGGCRGSCLLPLHLAWSEIVSRQHGDKIDFMGHTFQILFHAKKIVWWYYYGTIDKKQ